MAKDLTVGKPEKVLRRFCLPLFLSVVIQQLYNLADSFIAGKFGGEEALAAVGNSYEITLILLAFAFGFNIGGSVIAARLFGAKRYEDVKTSVFTTLLSCFLVAVLLSVFGFVFSKPLLSLIRTPDGILSDSALYLDIYLLGVPFVFVYNVTEGIFSGLGDSKTPFIFLASSSTANIALDLVFSLLFENTVAAVAWATFFCQSVSAVLAFLFLLKKLKEIPTGKFPVFSFALLKETATVAVPSTLQQSFISVGNIVIQGIINSFDAPAVVAGYTAAVKLNNLLITSLTTMGNGISNFTSQNLGAGKPERVRQGFSAGIKMMLVLVVPFMLLYTLLGEPLVSFFIKDPSETALLTGRAFLLTVAPFYFTTAVKMTADGVLRGAKKMNFFMIDTFVDLIIRVALSFWFSQAFGVNGIWFSWPVGWLAAAILSVVFYKSVDYKKLAEAPKPNNG